ncbi:MAG: peptidoglycan recognition family protein [Patescibacteria group bacterium]
MENKPNRIIWHHSADPSTGHQADKINQDHKKKWNYKSILGYYGGYHILIETDGTIFRYRADNEIGAHDMGENINSLGVALAGNFNLTHPTREQEISFVKVIRDWISKYNITMERVDPHRMDDATDCPGKLLLNSWPAETIKKHGQQNTREVLEDVIKYIQSKLI